MKNVVAGLLALGLLVGWVSTVSAQSAVESCITVDDCLFECDGIEDAECYNVCFTEGTEEVASAYSGLYECIIGADCEEDDDQCFEDACGELSESLDMLCDPCTDNPGPDCCIYANDSECDEGSFCAEGTDTTDCSDENNDDEDDYNPECESVDICFDECESIEDVECINDCLSVAPEDVAGTYESLVDCDRGSDCEAGDNACLQEACAGEIAEYVALCYGTADNGNNDTTDPVEENNGDPGNNDDPVISNNNDSAPDNPNDGESGNNAGGNNAGGNNAGGNNDNPDGNNGGSEDGSNDGDSEGTSSSDEAEETTCSSVSGKGSTGGLTIFLLGMVALAWRRRCIS